MNPFTKTSPQRHLQAPRSALRHLTTATLLLALVGATASVVQAQPAMQAGEGARHAAHHRMGPGMAGGPVMGEGGAGGRGGGRGRGARGPAPPPTTAWGRAWRAAR